MIPNITRGASFHGLIKYLLGPGRANEHVSPHLAAGDGTFRPWLTGGVLDQADVAPIAGRLETPTLVRGSQPSAGAVWHCSLSIKASDGVLTDEVWRRVAHDFMGKMGWVDLAGGEADMPWVAIHHGQSKAGNDHIHLVVSMIRDDGRIVDTRNDFARAQQACRAIETELALSPLQGHLIGVGSRGLTPAEHAEASATGAEPPRRTLERIVRAAAARAESETEFIEYVRADGGVIAPYFAKGGAAVTGFKVRLAGDGQRWFGGGKLARDLTLPRLRETWRASGRADPLALAAWASYGSRLAGAVGMPSDEQVREALAAIGNASQAAAGADPAGRLAAWAAVSHDLAGVLASLSRSIEGDAPGALADAAAAASRLGQLHQRSLQDAPRPRTRMTGAARVAHTLGRTRGRAGTAAFMRQLISTLYALADAAKALKQASIAEAMLAAAKHNLEPSLVASPAVSPQSARWQKNPAASYQDRVRRQTSTIHSHGYSR